MYLAESEHKKKIASAISVGSASRRSGIAL
jgi:hypothetical protein